MSDKSTGLETFGAAVLFAGIIFCAYTVTVLFVDNAYEVQYRKYCVAHLQKSETDCYDEFDKIFNRDKWAERQARKQGLYNE